MNKLISLIFLLLLTGCNNDNSKNGEMNLGEKNNSIESSNDTKKVSDNYIEQSYDTIHESKLEIQKNAYLLDTVSADLTGDNVEEEILLYISPSPFDEETGEAIHWEDLHLWQVVVKSGDKTYPLYNYDLGGKLSFWVTPEKQLLLVEDAASLGVYEYSYENGLFKKRTLIDSGITFKRSVVEW